MIGGQLGYARTVDDIVFIFGYENNRYETVYTNRDEERNCSANDLAPWSPKNGECVTEAGNEDGVTGIVVYEGEGTSEVVWKGFIRQQTWLNKNLEPAWG